MTPSDPSLRPCPFCGGGAVLEPDPWCGESVRVACANPMCGVAPRSEYLLLRFVDELRASWNRPHRDAETRREVGALARLRFCGGAS